MFSESELQYIQSQPLARLATVSPEGQPDVVPVSFEFDGKHFYIGSLIMKKTRKFWNVRRGNSKASFVIDDVVSTRPWRARGVKVTGKIEIVEVDGTSGKELNLRITPETHNSWGLEDGFDAAKN